MSRLTLYTIALLSVLVPAIAAADPTLECDGSSQIEIGNCVADSLSAVDGAVRAALGFARAAAEEIDASTGRADAVPALDAGQAAWESYREAHCAFVGATYGGGSGTGIAIDACKVTLGRARADALLQLAR